MIEESRIKRQGEDSSPEDYFRAMFESNPNPMWFYDLETLRFLAVNGAAVTHYGYSREEFLSLTIADIRPPEDVPALLYAVARTEEGLNTYELPWRHRRRDGTIIYVQITSQPLNFASRRAELVLAQDVTPQQLMQERLRESEARYRTLIESTFEGIVVHDGGSILDANEGVAGMFGVELGEMIGSHIKRYIAPESIETVARNAAAGVEHPYIAKGLRPDGSRFDVEIIDKAHIYFGQQVRVAALRDVTERSRAERRLRDNERLFRSLTDNAFDVITVLDREARILYESPAIERMTGFTPEELKGQNVLDRVHPEDAPLIIEHYEYKLRHPGVVLPFECRLRHKDGTWRHVEGTGVNLLRDRAVRGVVVNTRDITERKRVEAERDIERRVLDALIEQLPVAVILRGKDGRYTHANRQAAATFGVERDSIVGTDAAEFAQKVQARTPDGAAVLSEADFPSAIALKHGDTTGPLEYIVTTPDGKVRQMMATATPISVDEELIGTVIVGTDVTERRRVQEQLRQSQKMEAIGRLAGGVAHDFNNLLTAITGYSDLLLRREDVGGMAASYVEQIRRAAERAASLTQQLLAFSRKQMLRARVLNLNTSVTDVEDILRRLIGENIRLTTRLAPNLYSIEADPNQMEQVIINLAVNARDAMPEGGELFIETENADVDEAGAEDQSDIEPNKYCALIVRDTGRGMDEETRRHVFEPFFTTKEIGRGTGLGLSTVYGIVKQSDGHIQVESEPGRGTTFRILLPRAEAGREEEVYQRQTEAHAGEAARGTETVLIVEDEEVVRRTAGEVLRLQGYTVLEAESGQRALEFCRTFGGEIALMVTDVVMPEMSGAELASATKDLRPQMRVLYMSGYTDDAIIHHGVLDAGVAFIPKPWTPVALTAKVREVLEAK